jgi:asparagine synthase (glutamine-hydrolysing)
METMCGIAGEIRLDGTRADVGVVDRMAATMSDRGPDGAGSWSQGPVALGHRRLQVIDLSAASGQPIADPANGITGVFNGCIYNYQELRTELEARGHRFFSRGDSEVVLKSYVEWGLDFVDHFKGMFAVALVERDSGRVVLARDRLGIKPLYYTETSNRLRFASTLPGLLAGGDVDTDIDPVALYHYLTFHSVVPAPRTILRGVRKLPPATIRVVEPDGSVSDRLYWRPDFVRSDAYAGWTEKDWTDAIHESLTTAVQRRMVSDVPVGVLLSGGLDSSLIVALLALNGQKGLSTFSIGFESVGGREGDEFEFSDIIAREFETDHHQIHVPASDLLPPLEAAVGAMAEPMVSHDAVAFYLLSQEVAKHRKVVQSGQGADEVFAGYHWYPPLAEASRDQAVPVYADAFFDRDEADMRALLRDEHFVEGDPATAFIREHLGMPGAETAVDAGLRLDSFVMLVDDPVKRVDNMTMAHGLEARVPFLDHDLVELAAACPPEYKLAQGGKGVLKEVGRRILPWEVIDRKKGYFPVPGITHLEGKVLDRVKDALTAPAARQRGLFRDDYVNKLMANPNEELTRLQGNKLWQLGLLEMWLQEHGIR